MKNSKTAFVVGNCQIQYVKPAKMDDLIDVSIKVVEMGKAYFKMYQEIKLQDQVLCKLDIKIICVNSDSLKPRRVSDEIIELIK